MKIKNRLLILCFAILAICVCTLSSASAKTDSPYGQRFQFTLPDESVVEYYLDENQTPYT